jgi:hypothetical protein
VPSKRTRLIAHTISGMAEAQDTVEPVTGADALALEPKVDPPDGWLKKLLLDEETLEELAVEELEVT